MSTKSDSLSKAIRIRAKMEILEKVKSVRPSSPAAEEYDMNEATVRTLKGWKDTVKKNPVSETTKMQGILRNPAGILKRWNINWNFRLLDHFTYSNRHKFPRILKHLGNMAVRKGRNPSSSCPICMESKVNCMAEDDVDALIKEIKANIPALTPKRSKGECGRIGVMGGSAIYTGAPYFAAASALHLGADLAYVICCAEASIPIKSYSPEIIVYPYLDHADIIPKVSLCLDRLDALIIGPGMGRDPIVLKNAEAVINYCNVEMAAPIPLVIDADGLFMISQNFDVVKNYKGPIILTPNTAECAKLCQRLGFKETQLYEVAKTLNVVLLKKGEVDVIVNGINQELLNLPKDYITITGGIAGSYCRAGGQGDVLAGCAAVFAAWYSLSRCSHTDDSENNILQFKELPDVRNMTLEEKKKIYDEKYKAFTLASFAACLMTRHSSFLGFSKYGRSLTASRVITYLQSAYIHFFFGDA